MLECWELFQRKRGNDAGAEMARVLREQYGDIDVPNEKQSLQETEKPGILKFSEDVKRRLEENGFRIYSLTGRSIKSLKEDGKLFASEWHEESPEFEKLTSRRSEVAINPLLLFLPSGRGKTLFDQMIEIGNFNNDVHVPGMTAVLGEAADYIDLAFLHSSISPRASKLFGASYDNDFTKTNTAIGGRIAAVGKFTSRGLSVVRIDPYDMRVRFQIAPLIVPTG